MKKSTIFLASLFLMFLCYNCDCDNCDCDKNNPDAEELMLTVSGSLKEEINENNISKVTKLTINGTISGEDWNILFEMAVLGKLEILDMTNAKIKGIEGSEYWRDDEIPEYNFSGSKNLKEVFLPKHLKVIGTEAFSNCKKLTTVHFSNEIDSIATRAFYTSGLSGEFNIPKSLRVIAKQAFADTKFNKVIVQSDILAAKDSMMYTLYNNSVFANCKNLTEVIVNEGVTILEVGFTHCSSLHTVSLPNSLEVIGYMSGSTHNYIFSGCKNIETITLPKNLWFIGHNAFSYTSLKQIDIPDHVQYLWTYAFANCEFLEDVRLSESLSTIGQGCFEECKLLSNLTIPKNVTTIGFSAFGNCSSLQSITFHDNIQSISGNAFIGCTSLGEIILPHALESLGSSAFEGCSTLSKVIISNNLKEIEATTFKDCIELQNVILGESISTLGSACFFHCPKLTRIIIPKTVETIESYAFAYTGIKELTVLWDIPIAIHNNVFDGINLSKTTLKVPIGAKDIYTTSTVWQDFGLIEELW